MPLVFGLFNNITQSITQSIFVSKLIVAGQWWEAVGVALGEGGVVTGVLAAEVGTSTCKAERSTAVTLTLENCGGLI